MVERDWHCRIVAKVISPNGVDLRAGHHHLEQLLDWVWLLVPAQAYVAQFPQTFQEFPPRQEAASFGIDFEVEEGNRALPACFLIIAAIRWRRRAVLNSGSPCCPGGRQLTLDTRDSATQAEIAVGGNSDNQGMRVEYGPTGWAQGAGHGSTGDGR
jgi:hypothetical protein